MGPSTTQRSWLGVSSDSWASGSMSMHQRGLPRLCKRIPRWVPPEESWTKINVDGSLKKDGSGGGAGVVPRDHRNTCKAAACHAFNNIYCAEHVKLLACRRGVQMAAELGITRDVLETDNQGVARARFLEQLDRSRFGPVIHEIKEMMVGVGEFRVIWTR